MALAIGPLVYIPLPARTREMHVDDPKPTKGRVEVGAAIRATVLLCLSFWLYSVMQPADMMMAMIAAMVIVYSIGERVWNEAFQRIRATLYRAAVALLLLWLFTLSQHLTIIHGLIFLSGLSLDQRCCTARIPAWCTNTPFRSHWPWWRARCQPKTPAMPPLPESY